MNAYRARILDLITPFIATEGRQVRRALDFGSGDGWFAHQLMERGLVDEVVAVDVLKRTTSYVEPIIYDGTTLPFDDGEFDLVYAIDVIHHTPDHEATIRDLARCSSDRVLIKDHNHSGPAGRMLLSVLDELGNRRFGVPSLHRYQQGWEWMPWMEQLGFDRSVMVHPALCEPRPPLKWFVNDLHFIAVWERAPIVVADDGAAPPLTT